MLFKMSKLAAAFILATAGAASAQEADPAIDVNGDGFYSFPEINTLFPDVTDEVFTQIDTTRDGLLDMAEVMSAQNAGLIPVSE